MKLAIYTRYWTGLTWFMLVVMSIGLYTIYIWVADLIDIFIVYRTILMVFKTPQFYLTVALSLGCVLLSEAMFVYIKTEYFTEPGDFLRALRTKGQEDDPKKLDKIEKSIIQPMVRKSKAFLLFNCGLPRIFFVEKAPVSPIKPKPLEAKQVHVEPKKGFGNLAMNKEAQILAQ